jgi:hypothetical protein
MESADDPARVLTHLVGEARASSLTGVPSSSVTCALPAVTLVAGVASRAGRDHGIVGRLRDGQPMTRNTGCAGATRRKSASSGLVPTSK